MPEQSEQLSPSQRHTKELYKREKVRNEVHDDVQGRIEEQLRESGLA